MNSLDIYFPVKETLNINNLKQAFGGFVDKLNLLHKYLTSGYSRKEPFEKVIKNELCLDLDNLVKNKLSEVLLQFARDELNDNDNQRSEHVKAVTKKIEKKLADIEQDIVRIDSCISKVDNEYNDWKTEQSEKKKRTAVRVTFGLLGAFTTLFKAFLPLFEAAADPEPAPVDAAPQ